MWILFRDKDVKNHLKSVYTTLAICLGVAAVGSYVHVWTEVLKVRNFLNEKLFDKSFRFLKGQFTNFVWLGYFVTTLVRYA